MFVYTREAHPGENVPCHDSFGRKLACARLLREQAGIGREILVDDLAGTVHRAYGLMPNMTWVIARGGRIAYKANWTSAANVEAFLARGRWPNSRKPRNCGPTGQHADRPDFPEFSAMPAQVIAAVRISGNRTRSGYQRPTL